MDQRDRGSSTIVTVDREDRPASMTSNHRVQRSQPRLFSRFQSCRPRKWSVTTTLHTGAIESPRGWLSHMITAWLVPITRIRWGTPDFESLKPSGFISPRARLSIGVGVHDDYGRGHAGGDCAGVLIRAGGGSSPLLWSGANPFDDVADAIPVGIELRELPTTRSLGLMPGGLVLLLGRGMPNPAATQHYPGGGIGVGFVGRHVQFLPGMSAPPLIDQVGRLEIVAGLSTREGEADKNQGGISQDVALGGQSTTGTTRRVVIRFDGRRLLVIQHAPCGGGACSRVFQPLRGSRHVPCGGGGLGIGQNFAGPSRVLVGTNDRGLDRQEGPDGPLSCLVAVSSPGPGIQDRLRGAVPSVT